jgi:hypothetical protein
MTFEPAKFGKVSYTALLALRSDYESSKPRNEHQAIFQEIWSEAVEIYTYLSTWGLMRLKAEQTALEKQPVKQKVVDVFFKCLQELEPIQGKDLSVANPAGLNNLKNLDTSEYLGVTGLALALAQEFSFWANAVYPSSDRKIS